MFPVSDSWRRLPLALAYPLHVESMLFIVSCAVLLWIFSASLFGLLIFLTVGTGVVQTLLANLRHSAHGGSAPPPVSSRDFLQFSATPFKLLLVVVMWLGLAAQARELLSATWPGRIFTITGFALLPAFTALLALEDSLGHALSPARLFRFILRGGLAYLAFSAALGVALRHCFETLHARTFGLESAAALVFHVPQPAMLGWLVAVLYIAMVVAHVLGRITYSTHDFRAPDQPETAVDSPGVMADRLGDLLRQGNREGTLHAWKSLSGRDHAFQADLLDALLRERAWGLVPHQAQRTVTMKLSAGRPLEALGIAVRMLGDFASFTTATPGDWLALCRAASETGRGDWLELLAGKAATKFPDDEALLDIALLHAQHLATQAGDVDRALARLAPYASWHAHPRHKQVVRLRESLGRIQAQ